SLAFAVPGTILFTCCQVYGRMSAENEVVATKALGVSPLVLLAPAFGLAFVLSVVGVWLNDIAFSWGHVGVQRVILQSVEEIAYGMLRTQKSYSNQRFSIIVKEVRDRKLIRPIMHFQQGGDSPVWTVSAAEAELQSNLELNTLRLIMIDCEVDVAGSRSVLPGRTVQEIPLAFASARGGTSEGVPAHLPLSRIGEETEAQIVAIRELEQSLAAENALALVTGRFDDLNNSTWNGRRAQLAYARTRLNKLRTEPFRRWAAGFSSLCFVLVGAPFAIQMKKSDLMSTFGYVFVPILIVYYPFFMYGFDQAKAGALPPYSVWAANLIMVAIGLFLLRRVVRY
ncbi:MAG TPA: LptF/LptG family permease, partial [Pirellulaceae bacterium]|nr:LptF/LptG family permease [Pirellulaceae bacterium]